MGGAAGVASLAAMGVSIPKSENVIELDLNDITSREIETDILVIGGGIAGLFAAVKGHDAGAKVLVVSKGGLGSSGQTPFAKGIFAFDAKKESGSIDDFVDQVSLSAIGTNNKTYTRQVAEHSLDRVNELKEWGFFDSNLCRDSFQKPINERNIPVKERIMITSLIKENGKIAGAAGFGLDDSTVYIFKAKSVVLCTGAGGFKPNGFPICDLTHDGTIMAYDIGAKVTGKEWNDGHGGQSENAADCYTGWHGMFDRVPSTTSVGIAHDLGVDINYQAYMGGNPVSMGRPGQNSGSDVEGGPVRPEGLADRKQNERPSGPPPGEDGERSNGRPSGGKDGEEGGAPPGMAGSIVGGSSAGMSIHKSEGLVPINEFGESTIPGLYAAGDALGSYMCGGIYTQVGSSLAGSAVQGAIVSEAAAKYCKSAKLTSLSKSRIEEIKNEVLAPLKREKGYSPAWVTQTLQGVMIPNFVLYIKKERMLNSALGYVEELRDHAIPMLRAANFHELRLAHETKNMIISAEMKLKASEMRKESRCSHYRLDYPEIDYKNWQAWINIYKGSDGSMKFEKQAFDTWPV